MKDRSYLLTIAVGNDAVDLDEEVRRAVGWMSENIDEDGQHAVRITVHNYDTSQPVTEHEYIPEPENGATL
jgi:hypothetical protein